MRILFSESESYYRRLGLVNMSGFTYFFDGMEHYKKSEEWLFDNFDVFVCFIYTSPVNLYLTKKFNKLNIKTILVMDGVYDYSNSIKNKASRSIDLELYRYVPQTVFLVVGALPLYFSDNARCINYMPKMIKNGDSTPTGQSGFSKVLLTTANTAYFELDELSSLVILFRLVLVELNRRSIAYDVRIYDDTLYSSISDLLNKNTDNILSGNFEEIIADYSNIITTPSSIAITSMIHKRAVALLQYRDSPPSFFTGWMFSSQETIAMGLDSFISLDCSRMLLQERLVSKEFSDMTLGEAISTATNVEYEITPPKSDFLEDSLMYKSMLDSVFNFNIEYLIRRHIVKLKRIVSFFK
ncbi:hypothetical protein CWB96_11110 [Pseudoalteromonas citrea]|uniref:Polysaccharide pyruvyl transferase domain-containing protein n=1 Tax=Pseudoalteromonas citrea TaxID=43655 RepID=A0A5S3XRH3_9GAMM|nr:hypothetical protein [Pseudoalteromonas citrea]TMP45726.1 hypothetical protein CWB97_03755 [Pseudoalteromonas citrea]TMP59105.1 hypothetical protein CWB96_11110 [Pseudoalteromonas citrea]